MSIFLARFCRNDSGATAIEYGLISALIVVVIVSAIGALGLKLSSTFGNVASSIP